MARLATWTMRDGREIAVRDMTDDHLLNACRMLLRKADRLHLGEVLRGSRMLAFCRGEMAQDAIISELDELAAKRPMNFVYDRYAPLFNAARRRGLKVKD